MSFRQISAKLKQLGNPIAYTSLSNHFREHYDVQDEARELYYQSQAQLEEDARELVGEVQILDALVQDKFELHRQLQASLKVKLEDDEAKIPAALVQLYNGISSEIRQCTHQKMELLGDDPESKTADSFAALVALAEEAEEYPDRAGPDPEVPSGSCRVRQGDPGLGTLGGPGPDHRGRP